MQVLQAEDSSTPPALLELLPVRHSIQSVEHRARKRHASDQQIYHETCSRSTRLNRISTPTTAPAQPRESGHQSSWQARLAEWFESAGSLRQSPLWSHSAVVPDCRQWNPNSCPSKGVNAFLDEGASTFWGWRVVTSEIIERGHPPTASECYLTSSHDRVSPGSNGVMYARRRADHIEFPIFANRPQVAASVRNRLRELRCTGGDRTHAIEISRHLLERKVTRLAIRDRPTAARIVHQDRRATGQYIVRVGWSPALPAFSQVSGDMTIRRGVPLCAGVRGCCRHYCRQRYRPLAPWGLVSRPPGSPSASER